MRRIASVVGGLFLLVAASAIPVAADTTAGGNQLTSFSRSCSGTVCRETFVSASLDPFGLATACLFIDTYEDGNPIFSEFGCATASSFTITSDLAATLGPTSIELTFCDNANPCAVSRTVTVSASDTPTGPITTTTGRSTTKDGVCTTKIKFTDRAVNVAGTYTVNDTTTAETGTVSTHSETSKTTCRT